MSIHHLDLVQRYLDQEPVGPPGSCFVANPLASELEALGTQVLPAIEHAVLNLSTSCSTFPRDGNLRGLLNQYFQLDKGNLASTAIAFLHALQGSWRTQALSMIDMLYGHRDARSMPRDLYETWRELTQLPRSGLTSRRLDFRVKSGRLRLE